MNAHQICIYVAVASGAFFAGNYSHQWWELAPTRSQTEWFRVVAASLFVVAAACAIFT